MKQTWINKVLFGSCWSIMLWFLLIGIVLGFLVMGFVAIGLLPTEFYSVSNFIASITGASMAGLLLFMIPLSIVWNKNKEVKTTLISLAVVASLLNGIFKGFAILYILILIVSIVISCTTKKTNSKK
jgi:hypothetical protein